MVWGIFSWHTLGPLVLIEHRLNATAYLSIVADHVHPFKSNQIKSLLLSHHHSTSALVSEILMSVLQTVQKNNRQFTYGQTVQKNNKQFTYGQTVQKNNKQFTYGQTVQKNNKQFTYGQTVQKNNKQFTYGQTVQKNCTGAFTVLQTVQKKQQQFTYGQTVQKKKQQQFTYGQTVQKTTAIYIWTVHIYRLYRRQCAKYTYIYSVRLVYYRDILNYQRHIIHRMCTSTLCTVSIHNVVYT